MTAKKKPVKRRPISPGEEESYKPKTKPPVTQKTKSKPDDKRSEKPIDPAVKHLKHLSKKEFIEVGNVIVKGTMQDIIDICQAPQDHSGLKCMVAAVVYKITRRGDMAALDTLLNRLIGKVKDEVHHTGDNVPQIIVTLPSNGREAKRLAS
jgi:hypothetical protein